MNPAPGPTGPTTPIHPNRPTSPTSRKNLPNSRTTLSPDQGSPVSRQPREPSDNSRRTRAVGTPLTVDVRHTSPHAAGEPRMHKKHLRLALATATAAALTGGLLSFTAATATAADSFKTAKADFNGDGIGDVVASAPGAYVSGHANAGQVVVLYGTTTGISSAKRSTISQNTTGVPGTAETGDLFGGETAYADFNGDGYDDLAVGSPTRRSAPTPTAAPSPSSGARRAASPARASTSRTRPAPRTTTGARTWPPATSTVTARPTWSSAARPPPSTSTRVASAPAARPAAVRPSSPRSSRAPTTTRSGR